MLVLGIETSCDETGVAIYDSSSNKLLGHKLHSQVAMHAQYGGVVPELASRDHIQRLVPLLEELLQETNITKADLDAICYTAGPGLIGALLVGASFAKSLGYALNIPTLAVHHMEGHLLAPMLDEHKPEFPFVALLVSGGHTMLVDVRAVGDYKLLGESLDDAAGEAFDKTAKIMGLNYPGGPELAKLAATGDAKRFTFPRPMTNRPGLDFSFSGLKTHALHTIKSNGLEGTNKVDIAAGFEQAVIDTLLIKCKRALKLTDHKNIVIGGGVSANNNLRTSLKKLQASENISVFYPKLEFCTDNGAMIAYAGAYRLSRGKSDESLAITAKARWPLSG